MSFVSLRHYFLVIGLLLRRELHLLTAAWPTIAGSTIVFSSMMALSAGYFMPQMGMPISFAIPLFLGSFLVTCLSLGYTCAIENAYDLKSPRLALFYYALPVPLSVVLIGVIASLMLRMMVVSVPVLIAGLALINQWHCFSISWLSALCMMLLITLFNALLFLILAYRCPLSSLLGDVWPRFISPLFAFGCVFYTWKPLVTKSVKLSYVMLLSPMTYCCEGLRGALLGDHDYLATAICVAVLCCLNSVLFFMARWAIKKAINPVLGVRSVR